MKIWRVLVQWWSGKLCLKCKNASNDWNFKSVPWCPQDRTGKLGSHGPDLWDRRPNGPNQFHRCWAANLVVFAACNTPKVSRLNRLARFGRIKVENHVEFIPISLGTSKFALIISYPLSLKGLVGNTCFCPVFIHLFLIVIALFAVHAACSKPCWSSDLPSIVTVFLVRVLPDFLPCFPFELYAIIKWIAVYTPSHLKYVC